MHRRELFRVFHVASLTDSCWLLAAHACVAEAIRSARRHFQHRHRRRQRSRRARGGCLLSPVSKGCCCAARVSRSRRRHRCRCCCSAAWQTQGSARLRCRVCCGRRLSSSSTAAVAVAQGTLGGAAESGSGARHCRAAHPCWCCCRRCCDCRPCSIRRRHSPPRPCCCRRRRRRGSGGNAAGGGVAAHAHARGSRSGAPSPRASRP